MKTLLWFDVGLKTYTSYIHKSQYWGLLWFDVGLKTYTRRQEMR